MVSNLHSSNEVDNQGLFRKNFEAMRKKTGLRELISQRTMQARLRRKSTETLLKIN
jgi:hypothetical protein